jgi:hypothetical protein
MMLGQMFCGVRGFEFRLAFSQQLLGPRNDMPRKLIVAGPATAGMPQTWNP